MTFARRFQALVLLVALGAGCTSAPKSPWERAPSDPLVRQKDVRYLGSVFHIRVWMGEGDARAPEAIFRTAVGEFGRIARIVDADRKGSELAKINQTALRAEVKASPDMARIFALSQQLHQRSGGAFDISFAPIQEAAERFGPDAGLGGADKEFNLSVDNDVRARVGRGTWSYNPVTRGIRILKPGSKLVVKGVAKGYAAQKVAEKLQALKLKGFAVIGGGVLVASGAALKDPDLMCVEDPDKLGACKLRILPKQPDKPLALGAAATQDRPGHVYNPRSGDRTHLNGTATVAAPDAAWAQGAALAISIMDSQKTERFLKAENQPAIGATFADHGDDGYPLGSLEPYATTEAIEKD